MSVARIIEKVQRDFLWGGMGGEQSCILLIGIKFAIPFEWVVSVYITSISSIKLSWGNGFEDMRMRLRPCGTRLLKLSMMSRKMGGVQRSFWVLMAWVYGSILEVVRIVLPKGCGLRWGRGRKSASYMIFGAVINR
jgi:hypothetical protein